MSALNARQFVRPSGLKPTRVLLVDDSAVARATLGRIIADEPGFEVASAMDSATKAIAWLRAGQADIIVLDLEMPGLDGLTALPQLLEASAGAHVLIVSTAAEDGNTKTMQALALGATDTLAKPSSIGFGRPFAATLIERLKRLGASRREGRTERYQLRPLAPTPIQCLGIGSSTGGISALATFLGELPKRFSAPILITQHLPPPFIPYFVEQVALMSGRPTRIAQEGLLVTADAIIVADGEAHLGCRKTGGKVVVERRHDPVSTGCCPSVDLMFITMAAAFGPGATAIVLSGMGRDGGEGAAAVVAAGGQVLAQDRTSSAVWGMPGTVVDAGMASAVGRAEMLATIVARQDVTF